MTDKLMIIAVAEPTVEEILANMCQIPEVDDFESVAHIFPLNFKIGGEDWVCTIFNSAEIALDFTRKVNQEKSIGRLRFQIFKRGDEWEFLSHIQLKSNFIELLQALSVAAKTSQAAKYALMALEVPLEEIEAAA